jgi:signal transduction histidine kinase
LLGKFAITSLIPIVLLGLALARSLERQIRDQALTDARDVAAVVARLGIQPQLSPDDLTRGLTAARYRRLDRAIRAGLNRTEVARVKIWNRSGSVVYSDDRDLVGRTFTPSEELEDALHGEVASEVSDLTKEENAGDRSYGQLLEVYVPLRFSGNPSPVGAFEMYLPYRPIVAAVERDSHRLYLVLLAGLALLYAALFRIVASASKRLRRQTARELHVATLERDLALRKAAVIATVSHEFRTPLTIIQGAAMTLEAQHFVSEAGRPLLDGLRDGGRRLGDLVAAVLAAAEGSESESVAPWVPVDVEEACTEVIQGLLTANAAVRVQLESSPDAVVAWSDPIMVRVLLRLLIENALKFSPAESPVEVAVRRRDAGVEVRIRDHGAGISDEFLDQAFDPFTQEDQSTTRLKGGLGIGLFAAKRIADLLSGTVELRRHPEGGTEAIVHLVENAERPLEASIR